MTTVSATLTKLARSVGAYWRLNPGRRTIDMFTPGADADGNRPGLTNTANDVQELVYIRDATQLRNSMYVLGSGGSVASPAPPGATSLTVTESGWYSNSLSGGTVLINGVYYSYTGPSVLSGTGVLGISNYAAEWGSGDGLAEAVAEGDIPRVVLESLRFIAVLLFPFIPSSAERMWEALGMKEPLARQSLNGIRRWGGMPGGTAVTHIPQLFPRIE